MSPDDDVRPDGDELDELDRAVVAAVARAIVRQLRRDVGHVPAVCQDEQRKPEEKAS